MNTIYIFKLKLYIHIIWIMIIWYYENIYKLIQWPKKAMQIIHF